MQIEQHNSGRPVAFLVRELVDIIHGTVAVVNHFKRMGKLMGFEHPADEVDVHRIIFHDDDGQRSLHNGSSSLRAVGTSDMRQGSMRYERLLSPLLKVMPGGRTY